jgi:cytochrome c2
VRRPLATLVTAAVLGAAGLTASGCGVQSGVAGSGGADLANGKKLFITTCGGCHTLADAGTKGTIGPNLDDAYQEPRAEGSPTRIPRRCLRTCSRARTPRTSPPT